MLERSARPPRLSFGLRAVQLVDEYTCNAQIIARCSNSKSLIDGLDGLCVRHTGVDIAVHKQRNAHARD